jgi:hypothetical protein
MHASDVKLENHTQEISKSCFEIILLWLLKKRITLHKLKTKISTNSKLFKLHELNVKLEIGLKKINGCQFYKLQAFSVLPH